MQGLPAAKRRDADGTSDPSESQSEYADQARWSGGIGMQFDRIWRHRWLVAAIMVISTVAGIAAAASQNVEYTGQAVLSAVGPAKSDADPTLAQGYVFILNDPAYISSLRERAGIAGNDVRLSARTAALGPVFSILATSSSADTARSAAAAMAKSFADEINSQAAEVRRKTIATMTGEFRSTWGERLGRDEAEALAAQDQLQQQVNAINSDRPNEVTILALDAGVSEQGSGRLQTIAAALLGGVLLGCMVAILVGINSRRLLTDYDVAQKLGLNVLETLPSPINERNSEIRRVRLGRVMNIVVRQQLDQPMSIAVASTAGHDVAGEIANAIALTRANQGATTVLVQADLHRSDDETPGLADYLGSEQSADVGSILRPASDGLALISSGRPREVPSALFDRRRTAALIDDLRERAELVVVESPPLDSCSEAQVISDVTDGTLLIIEQGSRCDDAREAIRVLDQVGATLVGVVLAARPAASSRIESQTHNPA